MLPFVPYKVGRRAFQIRVSVLGYLFVGGMILLLCTVFSLTWPLPAFLMNLLSLLFVTGFIFLLKFLGVSPGFKFESFTSWINCLKGAGSVEGFTTFQLPRSITDCLHVLCNFGTAILTTIFSQFLTIPDMKPSPNIEKQSHTMIDLKGASTPVQYPYLEFVIFRTKVFPDYSPDFPRLH